MLPALCTDILLLSPVYLYPTILSEKSLYIDSSNDRSREVYQTSTNCKEKQAMKTEKVDSNSVSSVKAREDLLRTALDVSEEVLLAIIGKFGLDSDKYTITDNLIEVIKKEYAFVVARREFKELCEEKQMVLTLDGFMEIHELYQVKIAIDEQLKRMGAN